MSWKLNHIRSLSYSLSSSFSNSRSLYLIPKLIRSNGCSSFWFRMLFIYRFVAFHSFLSVIYIYLCYCWRMNGREKCWKDQRNHRQQWQKETEMISTLHEIIRSILFSMPCFHSTLKARFRFCYCCWPRYCNCSVFYSYVWFVFLLHSRNDSSRLLLFVTHSAHHSSICLDGWLVVCVFFLLILRIFYAKS